MREGPRSRHGPECDRERGGPLRRADIYHATSPAGTNWDWAVYKAQSQTEQGAWVQMFMGDRANFSLANLRGGIGTIFGGTAAQLNQRNHCLAAGRRKATRGEKLFSVAGSGVGNAGGDPRGATTNPDVLVVEGTISLNDIDTARNLL